MSNPSESDTPLCEGCGEPVDTEADFGQYDPRAPVYADEYVYHLGCEDKVFEWSVGLDTGQEDDGGDL